MFLHNTEWYAVMHGVGGSDRVERFDSRGLDVALGCGVVIDDVCDKI